MAEPPAVMLALRESGLTLGASGATGALLGVLLDELEEDDELDWLCAVAKGAKASSRARAQARGLRRRGLVAREKGDTMGFDAPHIDYGR